MPRPMPVAASALLVGRLRSASGHPRPSEREHVGAHRGPARAPPPRSRRRRRRGATRRSGAPADRDAQASRARAASRTTSMPSETAPETTTSDESKRLPKTPAIVASATPTRSTIRRASASPARASAKTVGASSASSGTRSRPESARDRSRLDGLACPLGGAEPEAPRAADRGDVVEEDHLARAAVRAAQEPAVDDDAGAEALAGEQRHVVAASDGGAPRALGECREGRVVLHVDDRRQPREVSREPGIHALPESIRMRRRGVVRVHRGGNADAHGGDGGAGQPRARQSSIDGGADGLPPFRCGVPDDVEGAVACGRWSRRGGRRP